MKIFKNKIFLFFIACILGVLALQFYFIGYSYKKDTNSYIILMEGKATYTSVDGEKIALTVDQPQKLSVGDTISVLNKSFAMIEWGDKSLTRLGENTKIEIQANMISQDLSQIQISFELFKGKTWSTVVSLFGGDSYFNEEFDGKIASVRGSVFEVNYENGYVVAHEHELSITDSDGESITLIQGEGLDLQSFNIEDISNKIDEAFQNINNTLDQQYLDELAEQFLQALNDSNPFNLIQKFSVEHDVLALIQLDDGLKKFDAYYASLDLKTQEKVTTYLESLRQQATFITVHNADLYNIKSNITQIVMEVSENDVFKELVVKNVLYDIQDSIDIDKFVEDTIYLLVQGKEYLSELDMEKYQIDFKDNILSFGGEAYDMGEIVKNFENFFNNIDKQDIKNLLEILKKMLEFLEKIFEFLKKLISIIMYQSF